MILSTENILLIGSVLLIISVIIGKTSFKFGVPTLLLFLIIGMLAGSEGFGGIHFDDPSIAQFIGITALVVILFSGGLDTKYESIKPVIKRGISLSTLGVLLTAIVIGLAANLLLKFSFAEGMLLGAIVSSTDAAAVFSILRSKRIGLKNNLRPTLELESGSNDPMAYFLTLTMTGIVLSGSDFSWTQIPFFILQMGLGAVGGWISGILILKIINNISLDFEGLYSVLLIAWAFMTFSAIDSIGGNGFLAVYMAGIIMGNKNFIHKKSLMRFFDGQAWLMQIVLFLTLGLLVFPSNVIPVITVGLLISGVLIFIARPLGVFISMMFSKAKFNEKLFISWVGLRGAVPIVFATYPLIAGVDKAPMIFNVVFFVAVTSVVIQGTTLSLMAKFFKVALPESEKKRSILDIELSENIKSELIEVLIKDNSLHINKPVINTNFPKGSLIVFINRQGNYITVKGDTVIQKHDKLIVLADDKVALKDVMNWSNQ